MSNENPINRMFSEKLGKNKARAEQFINRATGNKQSEDYKRGFTEGSEQATKTAVKHIQGMLGGKE